MLRLLVLTFLLLLCVAPIFAQTLSSQDSVLARSCGSGWQNRSRHSRQFYPFQMEAMTRST